MNMHAFIGVLLLAVITTVYTDLLDKRLAGRLDGYVYLTMDSIGELQCGYQCLITQKCLSINYERRSLTCQLSTKSDKANLTELHPWSYLDKPDILSILRNAPCGNWTCPPNAMCVRLSSGQLTCTIVACDEAPDVPNAEISVYKAGVSEHTTYTCNTHYHMTGTGNGNITCKASGTFTDIDFACDLIPCPAAPDLTYSVVGQYELSVGSDVTYSCIAGYYVADGPGTLTCELGGQWSTVTFSCKTIPCPAAPSVDKAVVGVYQKSVGSEAPYTCMSGYAVSNGPAKVSCVLGGTWTIVRFSCEAIVSGCSTPPLVNDATLGTHCQDIGCTATYVCEFDFIEVGSPTIQCQADGSWSDTNFRCEFDIIFEYA